MLYSLEPGLQRRFQQHGAYAIFEELKLVFQDHARVERYEVSDKFFSCKMEEIVLSVSTYSECLGCTTACLSWELISRMTRSLTDPPVASTKLQELCDELQYAGDGKDHSRGIFNAEISGRGDQKRTIKC